MRSYDEYLEEFDEEIVYDLISEIPIDLSKENIKFQLQMPIDEKNNVSAVLERLDMITSDCLDPDIRLEVLSNKQDFLSFVLNTICDKFDLGHCVDEDNIYELEEITVALYDTLVLHFKRNVVKFFRNYIMINKDSLVEEYRCFVDKRDLSGITYKNSMTNITVEDYVILVALPLIHKSLYDLTVDIDPIDFLDTSSCSMLYNGNIVKEAFLNGTLCGSFIPTYMGILSCSLDSYKPEILETVKLELVNRFKARSL